MAGYYDLVLGLIPFTLLGVSGGLTLGGVSLTTAVPVGAGIAVLLIGHAMFVNGPVDEPTSTSRPSSTGHSPSKSVESLD
jgi:hypothetical protein